MPAPLNNTNALKYTPAVVLQHLADIEREAANADMLYLGMVFAKLRISRKAWAYWKQRFTAHEDIMEQIDIIEGIFEARLYAAALQGKINASAAIFGLKHNHHWTDKAATEPTHIRMPMLIELDEHTVMAVP